MEGANGMLESPVLIITESDNENIDPSPSIAENNDALEDGSSKPKKTLKKKSGTIVNKKVDGRLKTPRIKYYYDIDISDIPSYINSMVKFMDIHPDFFKTNVSKKMIYLHDNQIFHVYDAPVYFKDTIHTMKGYITTSYDKASSKYKMIISIKTSYSNSTIDNCYAKQVESYITNQAKHGDVVELYYHKILNDTIIKHCYYNQSVKQWDDDVKILKEEFFLPSKSNLLSIMNNKINNEKIGSITNSWNNLILYGKPGTGKCLAKDTEVLMYDGSVKMIQDIKQSELVMGDDSTARNVLSTTSGVSKLFEISYLDNDDKYIDYVVNKDHVLSLHYMGYKNIKHNTDEMYYEINWFELENMKIETKKFFYTIIENDIDIDEITDSSDDKILRQYDAMNDAKEFLTLFNHKMDISVQDFLSLDKSVQEKFNCYTTGVDFRNDILGSCLKDFSNDYENIKALDTKYKISSKKSRSGILLTVLNKSKVVSLDYNGAIFKMEHKHKQLLNDIIFVGRSLGYKVTQINSESENMFSAMITIADINALLRADDSGEKIVNYYDISITEKNMGEYYGFELDGNHRFVLGNFAVTHNSSFIYRISMILKLSILSIDLSLYLNKKKELYALLHGQEFCLPNASDKQPAMTNVIIALEEFDNAIEHILDIENVFEYKDILKRKYLDMKNNELKEKANTVVEIPEKHQEIHTQKLKESLKITNDKNKDDIDQDYEAFMTKALLEDGVDLKNNKVFDKARLNILERREHDNEMHSINSELNNIIRSMDEDNKSNILRLNDLLELFSPAIPVKGRIIIGTTNHLQKMKDRIPALFRAGRMTNVEFSYLDWESLNQLVTYYFDKPMSLDPFDITVPTSEIVELAVKHKVSKSHISVFEADLYEICRFRN